MTGHHRVPPRHPLARYSALCVALSWIHGNAAADARHIRFVPPWFAPAVVYHNAFEGDQGEPSLCWADLRTSFDPALIQEVAPGAPRPPTLAEAGLFGRCLSVQDSRAPFELDGPAVSPHRPLTLSFWWALPYDLTLEGGYQLLQLNGKGMIALFSRGRGEWCALERPAGVFQVYYFGGIQNVNGIYDFDLMSHYDLKAGVWHHAAVVFRRAATAQAYVDGKLVFEVTISGREWTTSDALQSLTLGGPLYLDEVMLLDRAVDADMVADYYQGISRLREYLSADPAG